MIAVRRSGAAARGGVRGSLATIVAIAVGLGAWPVAGPASAASAVGPIRAIRCTGLSTDPTLEPPLYALQEGAAGGADSWWCDLPHATRMPANYVELRRLVSSLSYPYGLFSTYYGTPLHTQGTFTTSRPGIIVTVEWDTTRLEPKHVTYSRRPHGRSVQLTKGVTGTLVASKTSVSVTWRLPTSGVPRYLRGVTTVTVTGRGVAAAAVLSVAKYVRPG